MLERERKKKRDKRNCGVSKVSLSDSFKLSPPCDPDFPSGTLESPLQAGASIHDLFHICMKIY